MDPKELLEQCLDILRMEIKNIRFSAIKDKLKPGLAKDLASYTKLLHDLQKQKRVEDTAEESELSKLSDEELKARAKKIIEG